MTPFSFESSRKLSLSPKNDGFLRIENDFTEFFGVEEGVPYHFNAVEAGRVVLDTLYTY